MNDKQLIKRIIALALKIKETETFIDCPYCEIRFLTKEHKNKDNK